MKHNGDVVFEKEGCIAYISINKASSMNAIDADLAEAIGKVIKEVGRDPAIKVVIISGSGGKAFCAGADIKYLSTLKDGVEARRFSEEMHDLFNSIEALEKIVIAAIEGYCLGGGCELAMACDLRIAGSSSVFGQPEVKLGLVPGGGGTYRLQQIVGVGNAKELFSISPLFLRPVLINFFERRTALALLLHISSASSFASVSAVPAFTTLLTNPILNASSALMLLPENMSSFAFPTPTIC